MTISILPAAEKFLRKCEKELFLRLRERIYSLEHNPFPPDCERLKSKEKIFKVRVGDYRIFYDYFSETLIILRIRKRDNAYLND